MQWDLGLWGLAVLTAMSLVFGVVAQIVLWRLTTHWLWLISGLTFFVSGLILSEWIFGSATVQDLQPNVDGLSFDETLLAIVPGLIAVGLTWYVTRRSTAGSAA